MQSEPEQPTEEEKEETIATSPVVQRVPLAVREDDDEEKVATKLDTGLLRQEDEEEKTVATKLATDAPLQRQASEEDEREEETLHTSPIQREPEEEQEEKVQTKSLSSQLSHSLRIHSVHRSASAVIQRLCTECEEEKHQDQGQSGEMVQRKTGPDQLPDDDEGEEQQVQSKGTQTATPKVTTSVAANIHAMNGGGRPLSNSTRAFFEPRFGVDFSQVRVHTDSRAAETAKSINARAFTVARDIAFSGGQFAPESQDGRRLLAHELTHVVQQNGHQLQRARTTLQNTSEASSLSRTPTPYVSPSGFALVARQRPTENLVIQRDEEGSKNAPVGLDFPLAAMSASFSGLGFRIPDTQFVVNVPRVDQAMQVVLRRLLSTQPFPADLPAKAVADLQTAAGSDWINAFPGTPTEVEPFKPNPFQLTAVSSIQLISWLRDGHFGTKWAVDILPAQEELLALGMTARDIWKEIERIERGAPRLPKWYDQQIFMSEMTYYGALLRRARAAFAMQSPDDKEAEVISVADAIVTELVPAASALEAIRADEALVAAPGYGLIFRPGESETQPAQGAPPPPPPKMADPAGPLDVTRAGIFLSFARTQPAYMEAAAGGKSGAEARKELLRRFLNYLNRAFSLSEGDQKLLDNPGLANAPAFDAELVTDPPVGPPLFTHPVESELAVIMRLHYNTLFDAFTRYSYKFDLMRVPDEKWVGGQPGASGEQQKTPEAQPVSTPTRWNTFTRRLARNARYREADLRTYVGQLPITIGPIGITVADFVAALRDFGTIISTLLEIISDPDNLFRMTFPEEGLYIVRCRATPILYNPEEAEVKRPPSVTYIPVFAQAAEVVATTGVQMQFEQHIRNEERIKEIDKLLVGPPVPADPKPLMEEKKRLEQQRTVAGTIQSLRDQINERLKSSDLQPWERSQLADQLKKIDRILEIRGKRGISHLAERIYAQFVGDNGQSRQLLLDAVDQSPDSYPLTRRLYRVYDSTAPSSGTDTGEAEVTAAEFMQHKTARPLAIRRAVKNVLEGTMGYGRGYVTILIDGQTYTERVEASNASLLMEAISGATTILAIAAIVAAPFTGGASLYLLIPIGIVGAIPSAYRIATRVEASNFDWDLATAMDIVNIVSAFIGLGAEAAVAGQAVRLGKGLLITGFGADALNVVLMGADIANQLESLKDLPPELRGARAMEIISGAMLNAGIMIGGALAARARMRDIEPGRSHPTLEEWRRSLNEESRKLLKDNPELEGTFASLSPRVRDILTMCASYCVPPTATKAQGNRIDKLLQRMSATPEDERALKVYFHDNSGDLNSAISRLEGFKRVQDIRGFLTKSVGAADRALLSWPNHRKDPAMRQAAERVVQHGLISARELGDIMDVVKTRHGSGSRMLELLERLSALKPPPKNVSQVISELKSPYDFHEGARWVLDYIDRTGLWGSVTEFEVTSILGGRRWDALINGIKYEFKSWSAFYDTTFLRQILEDFSQTAGFTQGRPKWVFEPRLGTEVQVRQMMIDALNRAQAAGRPGFDAATVTTIINNLPQIVVVP